MGHANRACILERREMMQILSVTAGPHHVMSEREKKEGGTAASMAGWSSGVVVALYLTTMVKSSGLGFGVKVTLLMKLAAAKLELAFWWRASCERGR
jgi:hypothetical protein